MDDLQFRRNLYADPSNIDEEMRQAINLDPTKQAFVNDIEALEKDIEKALAVDVPEGLSEKLILRQTLTSHKEQKRKTRIRLSLAASIAFAVGLTTNMFQFSSAYNNLSDHALAHVYHEEGLLTSNVDHDITLASLNKKMATFGGGFKSLVGEMVAADYCRFDGLKSLHLVFKGESSPVTVFVIPHNEDLTASANFSDDKFFGTTIQFKESNIVVVGDNPQDVEAWQGKINQNIRWSI